MFKLVYQNPIPILFAIRPPSSVFLVFIPVKHSIAMLLVIEVTAFIIFPISKCELSKSMQQITLELPYVSSVVRPLLPAYSIYHISLPLAYEFRPIMPNLSAFTVLFSKLKLSFIVASIFPFFYPQTMLSVILPLAFILTLPCRLISLSRADVNSLSVGFVSMPVAYVDITIDMSELPIASCSSKLPVSFVLSTVYPIHGSFAISETSVPVTDVFGSTAGIGVIS